MDTKKGISSSPHIRHEDSTSGIMLDVIMTWIQRELDRYGAKR